MLVTNIKWVAVGLQQTRSRLQQVAVDLFSARGFDHVTVEEIARGAGVTPMTFFRHFPSKEQVLLDDPYDPLIADLVARQDSMLPALERARRGLAEAWSAIRAFEEESLRRRLRLAAATPRVRARVWQNNARTEEAIVNALVRSGAGRLEAVVAAGATMGALTAALLDWASSEETADLSGHLLAALDLLAPCEPSRA